MERLQKKIANYGYSSRRKAEELIKEGKVFVNGKMITELGVKVKDNDKIVVEGTTLENQIKEYYLLNKPRGYISTANDEKGRKTVVDLIDTNARIYPVGRLDYDTTGLLILTNDGELTNMLTHPKNLIDKEYIAKIEGKLLPDELMKLKKGVYLDEFKTSKSRVKVRKYDSKSDTSIVEITIHEGKYHQVKRMFEVVGHDVLKLKRTRFSFLNIEDLKSGEYRKLTSKEVKILYSLNN